jgi:hypothetical protein
MPIAARIDEFGRPAWIVLMVLGFIFFWPLGLAILAFMIWSGRMGCGTHYGSGHWQHKMDRLQNRMDRVRERVNQTGGTWWGNPPPSGNSAFDEYRTETLRRLEDEQREFKEFLHRLRFAKDKVEFDQFMAERRNRPSPPPGDAASQPAG